MGSQYIPMTGSARDALIAVAVLWVLFAVVVFLRLLGRHRGSGIWGDDILSLAALVSSKPKTTLASREPTYASNSFSLVPPLA